jgi:hypothetical protein
MIQISIKTELKKQVIYNNPQHFWSWFRQHIYMVQNHPSQSAIKEFMNAFNVHLNYYCKDLSFTVSFVNEQIFINFYARGNPIFIEAIVALVQKAPKLEGLEITAFEEADSTADDIANNAISIKTNNIKFHFSELTYFINEFCEESRRYAVMIYCPEYVFIQDTASLINQIYEHLVRFLGEQFIYQKILDFSFVKSPFPGVGEPIAYLKQDLENDITCFLNKHKT